MGADSRGLERKQRSDDELLSRAGFADTRLGGEPRRSRVAHLALAQKQYRTSHHDGVRSRPRRAGGHRPMLPGRSLAARSLEQDESEIIRENEWLEGSETFPTRHSSDPFGSPAR